MDHNSILTPIYSSSASTAAAVSRSIRHTSSPPPLSPSSSSSNSQYSLHHHHLPHSPSQPSFDDQLANPCGVTDNELQQLTVRQLNAKLQGQDRTTITMLKAKRRVLKNRGYALNCRVRRVQTQLQLESENLMLRDQLRYLRHVVNDLQARLAYYEPHAATAAIQLKEDVELSHMETSPYAPHADVLPHSTLNVAPSPLIFHLPQMTLFTPSTTISSTTTSLA